MPKLMASLRVGVQIFTICYVFYFIVLCFVHCFSSLSHQSSHKMPYKFFLLVQIFVLTPIDAKH